MTLRRGGKDRLQKPCKSCGEYYRPTGKATKLCPKCQLKSSSRINALVKLQIKVNKKNENM